MRLIKVQLSQEQVGIALAEFVERNQHSFTGSPFASPYSVSWGVQTNNDTKEVVGATLVIKVS